MARTADRVDAHVGLKLRARRLSMGWSQAHLADALGISFQQVQKYERGANRVSASMLYKAAQSQGVPPAFYFDGLPEIESEPDDDASRRAQTWLASREAWCFAEHLLQLSGVARTALMHLARDLAERTPRG